MKVRPLRGPPILIGHCFFQNRTLALEIISHGTLWLVAATTRVKKLRGCKPTDQILRPHSLVEERQVLNLLAGVRFSLRPPFLAMSSSDKDAGLSSRLPGFDSRHRLHLRRVAGNGAQHFAKVRQRENVDGVRFPDSPPRACRPTNRTPHF